MNLRKIFLIVLVLMTGVSFSFAKNIKGKDKELGLNYVYNEFAKVTSYELKGQNKNFSLRIILKGSPSEVGKAPAFLVADVYYNGVGSWMFLNKAFLLSGQGDSIEVIVESDSRNVLPNGVEEFGTVSFNDTNKLIKFILKMDSLEKNKFRLSGSKKTKDYSFSKKQVELMKEIIGIYNEKFITDESLKATLDLGKK